MFWAGPPGTLSAVEHVRRSPRPGGMRIPVAVTLLLLAVTLAACDAGGSSPAATAPATTAADAVSIVRAGNPLFDGLEEKDPDLIGQGSYWTADPRGTATPPDEWTVTFVVGWGDCQAGCIDEHEWTWLVPVSGPPQLLDDTGSPLPEQVVADRLAAAQGTGVMGRALAGPTCPVERPGDPACSGRPVAGAQLSIATADGAAAGVVTTDALGWFRTTLAPGDYVLTASPVEGLMGTPGPISFTVANGAMAAVDVPYDTGIR